MLIKSLIAVVLVFLVLLFLFLYLKPFGHQKSMVYSLSESEIQRLLRIEDTNLAIIFFAEPNNQKALRFYHDPEKTEEMMSISFHNTNSGIEMNIFLDKGYAKILKEYPDDGLNFINSGIVLSYISSLLDASEYSLTSFCDSSCDISSFQTVVLK